MRFLKQFVGDKNGTVKSTGTAKNGLNRCSSRIHILMRAGNGIQILTVLLPRSMSGSWSRLLVS
jgi:hypothetical protein